MIKKIACKKCQAVQDIELSDEQIDRLINTTDDVKDILPDHTKNERELFITGFCNACYNKVYIHRRERKLS